MTCSMIDNAVAGVLDLRLSMRVFLEDGDVERAQRLGGALCLFWEQRGYFKEAW